MRRTAAMAVGCLVLSMGVTTVGAGPAAAADSANPLPLTAYKDMLVDQAGQHVFLTGGGSNGVVVRTLEGAAVTTITNEPGANQMALSTDGARLYVALSSANAISAIDTTTLTEVARYETGTGGCPSYVAFTAGRVWFGYGCDSDSGNLGSIAVGAPGTPVTLGLLPSALQQAPNLAAPPEKDGQLVVAWPGSLRVLDVSTGTPSQTAARDLVGDTYDLAFTDAGTRVITTSGEAYKLSDLSSDGTYTTGDGGSPQSVASANGFVALSLLGYYTEDIQVQHLNGVLVRSYQTGDCSCDPGSSKLVAYSGLALAPDASRLYAITQDIYGKALQLRVLHDPGKSPTTVSMTLPPSGAAHVNAQYLITGRLASVQPIPNGATVTLQREGSDGTVNLPSVTTSSNGSFNFFDMVPKRGTYAYRASWAGDVDHVAGTTLVNLKVLGTLPSLSLTSSKTTYSYGQKALLVAHLAGTTSKLLTLYVQPYGGSKTILKRGTVDSNGNLSVYYTMSRRTTFTSSFAGDDTHEPGYVTRVLLSTGSMVSALSGYYATSGSYRLFHTSKDPVLHVSMWPANPGACVDFTASAYRSGSWVIVAQLSCLRLDSQSRAAVVLTTNFPVGTRFRMAGEMRKTTLNERTYGPWQYGKFTT